MNIVDVVLVIDPVLTPHALAQLKPNLFLKVAVPISSQVHISLSVFVSVFAQVHNCSMVTSFVAPSTHWSSASPFFDSLYPAETFLYFLSDVPLRMCYVYPIIWSKSIGDVISRCSNTPTVRSFIARTTASPWWSNILIQRKFFLMTFCSVSVRLWLCMVGISTSYSCSVLLPSYIS